MTRVLFAAAFDSQLKWCASIRGEFERRGIECRVLVPDIRNALSDQQLNDAGVSRVERVSWDEMIEAAVDSDVFVSSLSGPPTQRVSFELFNLHKERGVRTPVLVGGWVGIIIENLAAGYLTRLGCDIIAVNSKADWDRFHQIASILDLPTGNMLLTGLPFTPNEIKPQRSGPIRTVLFADQPTVPGSARERAYIYRQLISYAKMHPDRTVILKPRHRPGEDTFHPMKYHPEDVLKNDEFPPNFRIDYTPISEVLASVDLLLTLSSTAALEAIGDGCRVGLVLDLGVSDKHGNPTFLESGLLRTFEQISSDDIGEPDPEWLDAFIPRLERRPAEYIVDQVLALLEKDTRPSHEVWRTSYFNAAATSHFETSEIENELRMAGIVVGKDGKPLTYKARLETYGRFKRSVVSFGEWILPDKLATPVYRWLKSIGVM